MSRGGGLLAAAVLAWLAAGTAARGQDVLPLSRGTSDTLALVRIPPGTFVMGSPATEIGRKRHEGPQTKVRITREFWLGRTEVTQREYELVMGTNPSIQKGPDLPVNNVNRHEAEQFCTRVSAASGRRVRLPTEAEWEYACRAGTTGRYFSGEEEEALDPYAWFDGNSEGVLHPVGRKLPNPWGLHDMTGNAFEWCGNPYGSYPGGEVEDWRGPAGSPFGVLRPGVFYLDEFMCRSAARSFWPPEARDRYFGFRVCVETGSPGGVAPPGGEGSGGAPPDGPRDPALQSARVLGK